MGKDSTKPITIPKKSIGADARPGRGSRHRLSAAALMNNTKWREVFTILAEQELWCMTAWLDEVRHEPVDPMRPNWNREQHHPIRLDWIRNDHVADPGIGGPFKYDELLWIRVGQYRHEKRLPSSFQDLDKFTEALNRLGQLPTERTDEFVQINGYQLFD